jgi:hypothetical protein
LMPGQSSRSPDAVSSNRWRAGLAESRCFLITHFHALTWDEKNPLAPKDLD